MYKIGVSDDLVGTSKNDVALITIYHFIKLIIENIINFLMSLALFFVAQSMRRESPSNEDLLLLLTRPALVTDNEDLFFVAQSMKDRQLEISI